MLVLVSQLVGRSLITFDDAEPIGVLRDPIIDPANGKIVGYFFGQGFMFMKQVILAADDIVGYDEQRIVVQKVDVARQAHEEPKINGVLEQKIPVLGAHVITESGRNLGRANDLLLDTELNMVVRYYVHGLMQDRIIAAEHIIRIEKRGIIIDDAAPSTAAMAVETT